ncbi:MAG TPA: glycerophosphodiester phosphodiesterase family protein [Pyrinomonadaceae bacterium]|nr:glycerophosphodiester phosphodiesterase family protein [Pyrinomonadaceae bacterium]
MSRLPLIIGHRGASALAPENTLAAFRRAIADGADGIEFDVRLSRDGVAVVVHDATLERTGSQKHRVSDLTADELQATDVGSWFGKSSRTRFAGSVQFADEPVPLLKQVFELFAKNNGRLYLELKAEVGAGPELAAEVVRMIRQTPVRSRVVVECFDLSLLEKVKVIDSSVRTGALFEPRLSRPKTIVPRNLALLAQAVGADEIALHHSLARRRIIEQALQLKQRVVVWTVDDPAWLAKARALEIHALITNNPARLLAARDSAGV